MVNSDMVKMMEGSEGGLQAHSENETSATYLLLPSCSMCSSGGQLLSNQLHHRPVISVGEDLQIPYVCSPSVPA